MRSSRSTIIAAILLTSCVATNDHLLQVRVDQPKPYSTVENTMTVTGETRGQWYFEANFPLIVENDAGAVLAQSYAEAQGDWMTEEFVPFKGTITLNTAYSGNGVLILRNANPSGVPENQKEVRIPIFIDTQTGSSSEAVRVEKYIRNNISELSPVSAVLGGTFFVTDIQWTSDTTAVVTYEDGHIELRATAIIDVRRHSNPVLSFVIISDKQLEIEQIPSTLSIEHFSKMKLEGNNLELSVISKNDTYTRYALEYESNGLTISGIMNIPNGTGPFPLVLLNHGFIDPDVYTSGRGLKREQDYLARRGFAVLHSDYRGHAASDPSPDERNIYDAGLEYSMDIINAIKAVHSADLPSVDSEKIGMLGHSLGGGVTLNILTAYPNLVDAAVLYAPVHADAWENFMRWRSMREEGDRTRAAMGTRTENPDAWDALSASTYLDEILAPVLLFHGANDGDVPKEWSDWLNEELQSLQKSITYIEYNGEKHEFISKWDDFMHLTVEFLEDNLKNTTQWKPPINNPNDRVTKKPFGIFISPNTSPIQPERFSGYHTGTDFELLADEEGHDVEVFAVCDGNILYKNKVNGYGGVVIQLCELEGNPVTVLYGHLAISSIDTSTRDMLEAGDTIGTLGQGFSEETDEERAHLHFSIHRGTNVELRGYTQNAAELEQWIDPAKALNMID